MTNFLFSDTAKNAMDAATHKKNFINALRMAVSRCKDATWYETQDFDDPTIQVLTIATKAFLIDVRFFSGQTQPNPTQRNPTWVSRVGRKILSICVPIPFFFRR